MISGQVYREAVLSTMPDAYIKEHWSDFQHVTDSGILKEVARDNNIPIENKVELARDYFIKNATEILGKNPCIEIPGAKAFFEACREKHPVGIATGCWKASGEIKLGTAGFEIRETVLSSACDYDSRDEILENCLSLLNGTKENVIYFGDAVWDIKTTNNLGWNFIGIGQKIQGQCPNWFPDYSDPNAIFELISEL